MMMMMKKKKKKIVIKWNDLHVVKVLSRVSSWIVSNSLKQPGKRPSVKVKLGGFAKTTNIQSCKLSVEKKTSKQ